MAIELSSVVSRLQMVSTSDHASVVSMNLFVALLCACIVIGHLLEENRWVNESITALLIVSFNSYPFIGSYLDLLKSKWLIFIYFMWVGCRVCVLGLLFCCPVVEKARIF